MKKYITVAALLAAGTAFANAGDITKWSELDQYSEIGGQFVNGTWRAGWDLGKTQDFNSEWSVVFTVNATTLGESPLTLLALDTAKNGNVAANYSGLYGVTYSDGAVNFSHYNKTTAPGGSVESAKTNVTFVLSRTSGGSVSLSAYADGDFSEELWATAPINQSYSPVTLATMNFGGYNTDFEPGATFLENSEVSSYQLLGAGYSFGSVATAEDLAAYYGAAAVVPEPSAFGLLAGIGALALVASRRRRKA